MKEICLNIDGQTVTTVAGTTILQAAQDAGVDIPHLCYSPRVKPLGTCRLCWVRVEGGKGLTLSCNTVATEGSRVCTEDEQIAAIRKTILELILSRHRLACPSCDFNGACRLQDYAYRYQVDESRFGPTPRNGKRSNYTVRSEAIDYRPEKCILCGLCIAYCEEVTKAAALTFAGLPDEMEVSTAFGADLQESPCVLCGGCTEICLAGAMLDRAAIGKGRPKDLTRTRTTCVYCGTGCQIDLNVNGNNQIVRVTSPAGVVPNDGNLCVKGRFGMEFVNSDKRLTTPLIKRGGTFQKATWEEALAVVAARLKEIRSAYGADSMGGLSSAKCTNEENYVFQKFMRVVVGTNNVDHCARLCHASTVAGLAKAFGSGAMTNSIDEIKHAGCIFVIGSNTTEAHPVIGLAIKEAVARNGAKLIVADPRRIDLVRCAAVHLAHQPGTDVALINAVINTIVSEKLHNEPFIRERTEDFPALLEVIRDFTPEKAETITTVPAEAIRRAARLYATAPSSSIIYSMGITQHTTGTDNVLALANLAMLTGNVGKESAGVNPLRGQNNVQGACDMGALPNVYAGYQSVEDALIRRKFQQAWGVELPDRKGLTVVEMMHAVEQDEIKALYIMGENPALSDPNLNRTRQAIEKVDFLVVQDIFLTETAEYADVVLPSTCFAEKDGTFTNTERRVQRVRKAVAAPGEARNDWEILCDLAGRMGYPMTYGAAAQIMDEIAARTPIYGGISYDRLETTGLQWPCPNRQHPGTKYLHADRFTRGKGKFHAVAFKPPAETPGQEFPFVLSTGRQLYQFHTGTMTRKSRAIHQVSPTGYVEVHADDAERLGIVDGQMVEVSTRRGRVTTPARVTTGIEKGWLFMPFHFCEGPANALTQDALDPVAKIPEYKVCAAQIRAVL
jgi:formate dehydrogenase alpha subunit